MSKHVDKQHEEKLPDPQEPVQGEGFETLAERLQETEGISEDIADLIAKNWQKVAGGVCLLLLAVWLIGESRKTTEAKNQQIALYFSEAQSLFDVTDEKKTEDEETSKNANIISEKLKVVSTSASNEFYSKMASLYLAINEFRNGDVAAARERLEKFNIGRFASTQQVAVSSAPIDENIVDEFAAYLYAKLIFSETPEDKEKAKSYLTGLAYNASLLNVEAIVALLRFSSEDEARAGVVVIAKDVTIGRPELAEQLTQVLSQFGLTLP